MKFRKKQETLISFLEDGYIFTVTMILLEQ